MFYKDFDLLLYMLRSYMKCFSIVIWSTGDHFDLGGGDLERLSEKSYWMEGLKSSFHFI